MSDEKSKAPYVRQPIVSVLGHVDHGKTSLLDYIRQTSVQRREAGGITQGIGASVATTSKGKKITFIDTPGHAAFSQMRSRGASASDIALLIVAANDGMKPQTKEALSFIRESQTPFIVVITKIDLPSVDINMVKNQLFSEGVKLEEMGGDVPVIAVSSKTGEGIPDLLDTILLVAELNEVAGDPDSPLSGVVIETNKGKSGLLVSAVIKDGKLAIGDEIGTDGISAKVKGLFDYVGTPIKEALPGEPIAILGFNDLPAVGSTITELSFKASLKEKQTGIKGYAISDGQLGIFLKAATAGKLEAIISNLPAGVVTIYSGVGEATENDVFLAKSGGVGIFTFELKTPGGVTKLAATEGVKIENFDIIYKLFERLEEILKGDIDKVTGKALILAEFPFDGKRVAGCKVLTGTIKKSDAIKLMRGAKNIGQAKINSLRKEKRTIDAVSAGEEFGIILEPYLKFEIGDELLSVR